MSRKVILSIISGAALLAGADPAAAAADTGSLEEITVTARKKSEDILKTPVSVAAFSAEDIEVRGIVSVNDLANSTPGINISNISSGRNDRSFQQIALRGFTPQTSQSTLTATFIDGVPVASATALNSVTDPERIEILKGPQSAYFGRNTFAGAINVVNKLPGDKLGASISALTGTRSYHDVQGSLEGPLFSDAVSFRISARSFSKEGSYTNAANGAETLGDQSTKTGTVLLVAQPASGLTVKLFGLFSSDDDGPSAQGMLSAYEVRANNGVTNIPYLSGNTNGTVILPSLANCTLSGYTAGNFATEARVSRPFICGALPGLPSGFSPSQNTVADSLLRNSLANGAGRPISASQGVQGYGLVRGFQHGHLNIDYEIADSGFTVSSLTGINQEYFSELADLDNYDNTLIRNTSNPTNANLNLRTSWDFMFLVERETRDFSQELRLSYDRKGPLSGVIGVSYLKNKMWLDTVGITNEIVSGLPRVASSLTAAPYHVETQSAFFGLNYSVTDQFKISAEGRYQQDKPFAYTAGTPTTIAAGNSYGLPAGTFGPYAEFYSVKYNNFLPRLIAQYEFDNGLMAYASASKGVNVAINSFNTNFITRSPTVKAAAESIDLGVLVKPEKLTNYELGLKGKFLDGRMRASLALYHATWTDQINQRSVLVQDEPPPVGTGRIEIVAGPANSGKSIVQGIELDVAASVTDNLTVSVAAAMNDSDIRAFSDPAISKVSGVIGDGFKGNQLPASSKFSANLGVQYGMALAALDDGSWFVRGDLSYKDKQYADAANLTWIKARTLVNLRAGVASGPFSVEAFINNAFNDKNYVSVANNSVLVPGFALSGQGNGYLNVGLPDLRTLGVKVGYKY